MCCRVLRPCLGGPNNKNHSGWFVCGHVLCALCLQTSQCRHLYIDRRLGPSDFVTLVSIFDSLLPGALGQTNHSQHFCRDFGRILTSHLQLCVALQHWARVPALNLPSDFSRVLDAYTCAGEPCQILVHIITLPTGDLEWVLLDVISNAAQATLVRTEGENRPTQS